MSKEYSKKDNKTLEVVETKTTTNKQIYSYDFILNTIQELTEKLAFFNTLKDEADKLNLTR